MSTQTSQTIEPFFFGPAARRLYGCYHEPQTWPAREAGVIICYAQGQEYIRAHRACHHLAVRLAGAGFPVLRFDYYGSGDSAGDSEEADLGTWLADLRHAVSELRARSGVGPVLLAGLRLGATMACMAAPRLDDVAGLVLWEPVCDGEKYLEELRLRHEEAVWRSSASNRQLGAGQRPLELHGFAISESMLAGIEQIDLLQTPAPRARPVLLLESSSAPELTALAAHLKEGGARLTHEVIPSFTVWVEDVDKGLVPHNLIEAIASWMEKVFA